LLKQQHFHRQVFAEAGAESGMFIEEMPSTSMSMTRRWGIGSGTHMDDGRPKPIVPSRCWQNGAGDRTCRTERPTLVRKKNDGEHRSRRDGRFNRSWCMLVRRRGNDSCSGMASRVQRPGIFFFLLFRFFFFFLFFFFFFFLRPRRRTSGFSTILFNSVSAYSHREHGMVPACFGELGGTRCRTCTILPCVKNSSTCRTRSRTHTRGDEQISFFKRPIVAYTEPCMPSSRATADVAMERAETHHGHRHGDAGFRGKLTEFRSRRSEIPPPAKMNRGAASLDRRGDWRIEQGFACGF